MSTDAKILFYDLEVTPLHGWAYDRWDTRLIRVDEESHIMCMAWKWGHEGTINVMTTMDSPAENEDQPDKRLAHKLRDLLDEADIVVAHNAKKFDNRVANARFIVNGIDPPSPYRVVDTLAVARRHFKFSSNSLNELAKLLLGEEKPRDTHAVLWHDCLMGDATAWRKMKKYCKKDVALLERLYLSLLPYMSNHPTVDSEGCPRCGHAHFQSRGVQKNNTGTYRRYQCQNCGGWLQVRLAEKDTIRPIYKSI